MSYCEFYNEREVKKTRKNHRCQWCNEPIPAGSSTVYTSGVFEGDFFSGHMHKECAHAMHKADCEDGYIPGEHARGSVLEDGGQLYTPDGNLTPLGNEVSMRHPKWNL